MLNGIYMDVVQMSFEIPIVPDVVFIETALPDAAIALPFAPGGDGEFNAADSEIRISEIPLNGAETPGIVILSVRQAHENMDVIRQENQTVKIKRIMLACFGHGATEKTS